jgi:hypothetical protein
MTPLKEDISILAKEDIIILGLHNKKVLLCCSGEVLPFF